MFPLALFEPQIPAREGDERVTVRGCERDVAVVLVAEDVEVMRLFVALGLDGGAVAGPRQRGERIGGLRAVMARGECARGLGGLELGGEGGRWARGGSWAGDVFCEAQDGVLCWAWSGGGDGSDGGKD